MTATQLISEAVLMGVNISHNSFKDYFKNSRSKDLIITYPPEILNIHGQNINLGYKRVDLIGVKVVGDLDNVEKNEIKIMFKKMYETYSKFPFL